MLPLLLAIVVEDNARKLFVDAAKQMEKDGSLNLEDILSGGEMIE